MHVGIESFSIQSLSRHEDPLKWCDSYLTLPTGMADLLFHCKNQLEDLLQGTVIQGSATVEEPKYEHDSSNHTYRDFLRLASLAIRTVWKSPRPGCGFQHRRDRRAFRLDSRAGILCALSGTARA
jgi:hypothetical protein